MAVPLGHITVCCHKLLMKVIQRLKAAGAPGIDTDQGCIAQQLLQV